MTEPSEPRKGISAENWEMFLQEFTTRNASRRARFDIFFASGETLEEGEEGHLESVALDKNGNSNSVVVKRTDQTGENAETMTDMIENVRRVAVQFETDGSENALEITDGKNTLFSLRLESKVDGNS